MDNLTHTLVGVLVGETAARATRPTGGLLAETRRNIFVTLMAVGSNVPDLDFIRSRILDSKLDYLLHHRGHTHTILGALVIAALMYLAVEGWARWRRHSLASIDRIQILGVAAIATLLHIALDATNSYGVHPFWPVDNRWYYGDAVFILEPLFWATCAPLAFLLRSWLARILVILILVAGVVLSFVTGMVPLQMAIALTALTAVMALMGKFARPLVALGSSIAIWIAINVSYAQVSGIAEERIRTLAHASFPNTALLDAVLTPLPVNPFCWQVLLVQADNEQWFVRRALLSLAPAIVDASSCPTRGDPSQSTAPFTGTDLPSTPEVVWNGEVATRVDSLRRQVAENCAAASFMRFARAPWLVEREGTWILGDARFDYERELSFAEIDLGKERCPVNVPPWDPPRADLLR